VRRATLCAAAAEVIQMNALLEGGGGAAHSTSFLASAAVQTAADLSFSRRTVVRDDIESDILLPQNQ